MKNKNIFVEMFEVAKSASSARSRIEEIGYAVLRILKPEAEIILNASVKALSKKFGFKNELEGNTKLVLDAFVKTGNKFVAYEFDGPHHCDASHFFNSGSHTFEDQQAWDARKDAWCQANGIEMIRISTKDFDVLKLMQDIAKTA